MRIVGVTGEGVDWRAFCVAYGRRIYIGSQVAQRMKAQQAIAEPMAEPAPAQRPAVPLQGGGYAPPAVPAVPALPPPSRIGASEQIGVT
jgi:hypothetical protein